MTLELPIPERARRFGYIFWCSEDDANVEGFFGNLESVTVIFQGSVVKGKRRIDRKYRRISLGAKRFEELDGRFKRFRLTLSPGGRLDVRCT